jgi:glycosyltransferase involved in cell wall biosynthesis
MTPNQAPQMKGSGVKRILLMSRGMARYRLQLTEALSAAFRGKIQIVASPSPLISGLWEVDWEKLKDREGTLLFRQVDGVSLRDLGRALVRRFAPQRERGSLDEKNLTVSVMSPDLIAIHEYSWFMVMLALYARLAGIPCVVFTELGRTMRSRYIGFFTRLSHTLGAWLTTAQVANTPAARNPFGAPHRPVFYLPYAVDTDEFKEKPRLPATGVPRILVVGQYIPRKGVDLLLEALKRIFTSDDLRFRLRLVGNQDDTWIKREVEASGLGAFVDIVGIRQGVDLVREYHEADIFVLPSRFETYGVVVHEAASCGLPLLVSSHAGAAEVLVKDGENGWIIDPRDSAGFEKRLKNLLESPELRSAMGRSSREVAEQLCIQRQTVKLAEWMSYLIENPDSKSAGIRDY